MYQNSVLMGDVAMLGQLPTTAVAVQPAVEAAPAAPVRTNNNRARNRVVPSAAVKSTSTAPAGTKN